jgi:branched-chain amino acid transport system substrate-binding protein
VGEGRTGVRLLLETVGPLLVLGVEVPVPGVGELGPGELVDAENKKWADRFKEKTNTRPSFAHAANYSAAMNYLEAVQEAGTDNADAIVGKLEGKKINDVFLRNGEVRKADHAVTHDVYLAKVKSSAPEEWDYEDIEKTIPAAEAYGEANPACKMG